MEEEDKFMVICNECLDNRCSVVQHLTGTTIEKAPCQCECHGRKQELKTLEELPPHHNVMVVTR